MQMQVMDMSLRDPEARLGGDNAEVFSAGLMNPDEPYVYTDEDLELLYQRKKHEYELILKLDKAKINVRKECWYLVDSNWLNKWASFVHVQDRKKCLQEEEDGERPKVSPEDDNDPPGPLSTEDLVDKDGKPLENLKAKIDYRGVPALSYHVLQELYGKDAKFPDLPRYEINIYKPEVTVARLVNIQFKSRQDAKIQVAEIRPKWIKWELSDDEDEEEDKTICCGLTKEHLETFIYWLVRCCWVSRKKDGRDKIKYSEYNPMMYKPGDSTHGLDSSHGANGMDYSGHSVNSMDSSTRSVHSEMDESTNRALNRNTGMDRSKRGYRGERRTRGSGDSRRDDHGDGISYAADRYESSSWLQRFGKSFRLF